MLRLASSMNSGFSLVSGMASLTIFMRSARHVGRITNGADATLGIEKFQIASRPSGLGAKSSRTARP